MLQRAHLGLRYEVMAKLVFFTIAAPRVVPVLASIAAHAAIAVAAAGYGAGPPDSGPHELQIDVESPVAPLPVSEKEHRDVLSDAERDHAEPHSHPYPVAPDHDAHPHSPRIDHRGLLAAAPSILAAAPSDRPTFSMVIGSADSAVGGLSGAEGTGDGSGTGIGDRSSSGPVERHPGDGVFSDAAVSERARLVSALRPDYPPAPRAQGIEASVSLEIVVDREGNVAEARVVRGAGYGFEESALRALRQARFSPAVRGGQTVRVRMQWTVDFRLE
jgi:TonB family protein